MSSWADTHRREIEARKETERAGKEANLAAAKAEFEAFQTQQREKRRQNDEACNQRQRELEEAIAAISSDSHLGSDWPAVAEIVKQAEQFGVTNVDSDMAARLARAVALATPKKTSLLI